MAVREGTGWWQVGRSREMCWSGGSLGGEGKEDVVEEGVAVGKWLGSYLFNSFLVSFIFSNLILV